MSTIGFYQSDYIFFLLDIVNDLREYYEAAARSCARGNCLGKLLLPQEASKLQRIRRNELLKVCS